jgi:hypothetical protein
MRTSLQASSIWRGFFMRYGRLSAGRIQAMKTGRGWWALAVFSVLTLLGLYVGAYYSMVQAAPGITSNSRNPHYGPWLQFNSATSRIFWSIHQIDRQLRPQVWSPPAPP